MKSFDAWGTYDARLKSQSLKDNDILRDRTANRLANKLPSSLSYKTALINDLAQNVAIIDEEDYDIKRIISMPGETLPHGGLVEWAGFTWLITEIDPHQELYVRGQMERCNHLLRWINHDGVLVERWCIVVDGTKYLIGEKAEPMMSIGDARIAITIGKDAETSKLERGRRFLIDDPDTDDILAYQITKPNRLFNVYGGKGVFKFILNEVNSTDNDNKELRIADYYNWKPEIQKPESDVKTDATIEDIVDTAVDDHNSRADKIEQTGRWI